MCDKAGFAWCFSDPTNHKAIRPKPEEKGRWNAALAMRLSGGKKRRTNRGKSKQPAESLLGSTRKGLERSPKIELTPRDPLRSHKNRRHNTRQIIIDEQLILYGSRDDEDILFRIVGDETTTTFYSLEPVSQPSNPHLHTLTLC